MKLREHQELAITQLRNSLRYLKQQNLPPRVMLAACTSFGKTITAGTILKRVQDSGKRSIFFCDRTKLVDQSINTFLNMDIDLGVIQSQHELRNFSKPVQIASIQTVEKMMKRGRPPVFDFAIIDEAHSLRASYIELMESQSATPFIGLSATPYTKGLGKYYHDLIVPVTPRQLLDKGFLCPIEYYGGSKPDLSRVGVKTTSSGTEYIDKDLANAVDEDKALAGDIVKNWEARAKGLMTIAFSPSVAHSKKMVELFNGHGYPAAHIDGYMDSEQQKELFEAHHYGDFLILSCSRLLNTGYDESKVECLIDCYPTKSATVFVQRAGRIMRIAEGKEKAIYLDHAGNVAGREGFDGFGFAEDIVPERMNSGEKQTDERELVKKEKKEAKQKECPQCSQIFVGVRCACGYEVPITKELIYDDQELKKIEKKEKTKLNKEASTTEKAAFYGELILYGKNKGFQDGWAKHKYKERFSVWPSKITPMMANEVSAKTQNYITHLNIRKSKGKMKGLA